MPRDGSPPYWSGPRVAALVVGIVAALVWLVLAFVAMAAAWGARGEAKPAWFLVVMYTTHATPLLGLGALALGLTRWPRVGLLVLIAVLAAEISGVGVALSCG